MNGTRVLIGVAHKAGLAFALLVPASAALALALHVARAGEVPSPDNWESAARAVRAAYQPGDLVAFLPGWAQEGRGRFRGLEVVPQERWGEDDVANARRVFVVSSFGAELPAWLREAGSIENHDLSGRIVISRVRLRGALRPLTDFSASTLAAAVTLEFPDRKLQCPRRGERHDCSEGRISWRWVANHLMVIDGRTRSCVYAHPTTGAKLRIAYPPLRLGRTLVVSHGLSDPVAQHGARVDLEVFVGAERAAAIAQEPRRGWGRARLDTTRWNGGTEPVTFVVSTTNDGSRHFCFAAEARE